MMSFAWIAIFRREITGFFYSPIAYVVSVAFLAVNGFSFWVLWKNISVSGLSTAPNEVLEQFFGGTLLHWFVIFSLISLLSMRTIAEDKMRGLWQATITTQVSVPSVLIAKWLALAFFYTLLWLPSFGLILVFQGFLPSGLHLSWGEICTSYLAVLSIGSTLLAVGMVCSAMTYNQVIASVMSFSLFVLFLMAGEVPQWGAAEPIAGFGPFHLGLRQGLSLFSRGELSFAFLWNLFSLTVLSINLATIILLRDALVRRWAFGIAVVLTVLLGSSSLLIDRHLGSLDFTSTQSNSLKESTKELLTKLSEPVEVTVLRPVTEEFDLLYVETIRLLHRVQKEQSFITITPLDPISQPQELRKWAFQLSMNEKDLQSTGSLVFQMGARVQVIDLVSLARFQEENLGIGVLDKLLAESHFRRVLSTLMGSKEKKLCVSTGHGEFPMASVTNDSVPHWGSVAKRIARNGIILDTLSVLNKEGLSSCDALVVFGAVTRFGVAELTALEHYLQRGGDVLVALRSKPEKHKASLAVTGIELLLSEHGIRVLHSVVVDPTKEIGVGTAWAMHDGFGEHSIVNGFHGRRTMIWDAPLALEAERENGVVLAYASANSWGESNLLDFFAKKEYQKEKDDLEIRSVAVASKDKLGARIVVIGSAESLSSTWFGQGVSANALFLHSSVLWVLGQDRITGKPVLSSESVPFIMSKHEIQRAFWWCVCGIPGFFACIGIFLWWWRRRV